MYSTGYVCTQHTVENVLNSKRGRNTQEAGNDNLQVIHRKRSYGEINPQANDEDTKSTQKAIDDLSVLVLYEIRQEINIRVSLMKSY